MNLGRVVAMIAGGSVGSVIACRTGSDDHRGSLDQSSRSVCGLKMVAGVIAGATAGALAKRLLQFPERGRESKANTRSSMGQRKTVKPTPLKLFIKHGFGTEYETRLESVETFLTPNERFYVRSHGPTPLINVRHWRLQIEGDGVLRPIQLNYEALSAMPQVTTTRAIECAGNGRRFFKHAFGIEAEGSQWGTGAVGCADWTGVRLRDVLQVAGLDKDARDVMTSGLDDPVISRSIPIEKALRDDTLLVLKMNSELLPPDHGFPVRLLVSGWAGITSVKWVGTIQVSRQPLFSKYNTEEYVLAGPDYPKQYPALGPVITEMPITSMLDLHWLAQLHSGRQTIRGRAFAGEGRVLRVEYSIDDEEEWRKAEIVSSNIEGAWVQWQFDWNCSAGDHQIRVRATDDRGRTQPEAVPWNDRGYLYNAIVAHPIRVI